MGFLGFEANWELSSPRFCALTIKIPFFMKGRINIFKTVYKDMFKMLYFLFLPCTSMFLTSHLSYSGIVLLIF